MAKRTIPRTCENCQKPFLAERHEINVGKARFCSKLCANYRGESTYRPCEQCGTPFAIFPSQPKNQRHCSRACRNAATCPIEQRFWAKVDKSPGYGPSGECWIWIASKTRERYGRIKHGPRQRPAHAVSWEIHNGPVPDGLNVLHRCDYPPCVRPDHLFVGTQADNMRDMISKGRRAAHGRQALTASQVIEIRRLYAAGGTTYSKLGVLFGVGSSAINHIVHRRTWANLS